MLKVGKVYAGTVKEVGVGAVVGDDEEVFRGEAGAYKLRRYIF